MNFTFENQGTNTFLVYKLNETDEIDSMSLGMLSNNKIPGLTQTVFLQIDSEKYIKYNVSAKVSAKHLFDSTTNKKRLIGVFLGIVEAMLSAENYMIDPSTILFDLDYIFANVSTCETEMICLPVATEVKNTSLGLFLKNILYNAKFDQTESCDYVAKIMNYLNSTPNIVLEDFKKVLKELEKTDTIEKRVVNQAPSLQTVSSSFQISNDKKPVNRTHKEIEIKSNSINEPIKQPDKKTIEKENVQQQPIKKDVSVNDEAKMSLMYLLQHYNKENAAIYKAQKNNSTGSKTKNKNNEIKKKVKSNNSSKKSVMSSSIGSPNTSFAIPGKPYINTQVEQKPIKSESKKHVEPSTDEPLFQIKQKEVRNEPVEKVESFSVRKTSFGETTLLSTETINETTVLSNKIQEAVASPYLIRQNNNERIVIDNPVFKIGKERSFSDYCISDNKAISRSHAYIVVRDDNYYIVDTNSTNHTYVNGRMIQSNEEVLINEGDIIRLANEEFTFKLF